MTDNNAVLKVRDLYTHYSVRGSFLDRLRGSEAGAVAAVDGVSFDLKRGEVLGLVGESGSGKTTLGRTLLGLVRATSGSVELEGQEIAGMKESDLRPLRKQMQIVFQDPHASLNPAMTIGTSVGDPLRFHGIAEDRIGARAAGDRGARARRPRPRLAVRGQVPDRPLRRPEAARGARPGDHPRPRDPGRRRARLDARHERAGEDPRADDRAQVRARPHLHLHHPRPGDGEVLLRPDRDHVPGQDRRARPGREDLRRPQAPVHAVAAEGDPGAGPGAQRAPRPAPGRDSRRGLTAARAAAFTRAARARSRSAAGRAATSARYSRRGGRPCPNRSTSPSAS